MKSGCRWIATTGNAPEMGWKKNRTGQTSDWVNPDTGRRYTVTPRDTFSGPDTQPCREFVIESSSNGRSQRTLETACRRPDGIWEIRD